MMASRSKKHKALEVHNTMKQISKPMTIMDVDAAYRKGFTEDDDSSHLWRDPLRRP